MLPCQWRVERLPRVGFPVMRPASRDAAPRLIYVVRPHRLALCEIPAYTPSMLDVIDLCEELCLIPSTTGEEAAVVNACERVLQELGLEVRRQPVGDVPGRDNLLATWPGCQPEILLTTHLDTVPPFIPPKREADRMSGRGTCDAKGIAAAMICAAERLAAADERRVALLFVVGEELDSDGARAAAKDFVPSVRYFIDGEPTELKLAVAMKGAITFDLEAKGKACHSAYPELGHSAVHQLLQDLSRLIEADWPIDETVGATTLNIGTIEGGVAPNVVAPHAKAQCVMRASTDAQQLLDSVRARVDDRTEVHVRSASSPIHLESVPGEETCVVAFGSDVPYLAPLGKPLLVGPGSIHDAHTDHEHVLLDDLVRSVALYQRLTTVLLSAPTDG